jgi:hypothetical protein
MIRRAAVVVRLVVPSTERPPPASSDLLLGEHVEVSETVRRTVHRWANLLRGIAINVAEARERERSIYPKTVDISDPNKLEIGIKVRLIVVGQRAAERQAE